MTILDSNRGAPSTSEIRVNTPMSLVDTAKNEDLTTFLDRADKAISDSIAQHSVIFHSDNDLTFTGLTLSYSTTGIEIRVINNESGTVHLYEIPLGESLSFGDDGDILYATIARDGSGTGTVPSTDLTVGNGNLVVGVSNLPALTNESIWNIPIAMRIDDSGSALLHWFFGHGTWETGTTAKVGISGGAGGGGSTTLGGLTDVDLTTNPPASNDVLTFTGSEWEPTEIGGFGHKVIQSASGLVGNTNTKNLTLTNLGDKTRAVISSFTYEYDKNSGGSKGDLEVEYNGQSIQRVIPVVNDTIVGNILYLENPDGVTIDLFEVTGEGTIPLTVGLSVCLSKETYSASTLESVESNVIPALDNTYDLGSATHRWKDVYVSPGSLHVGDGVLGYNDTSQKLYFKHLPGDPETEIGGGGTSVLPQPKNYIMNGAFDFTEREEEYYPLSANVILEKRLFNRFLFRILYSPEIGNISVQSDSFSGKTDNSLAFSLSHPPAPAPQIPTSFTFACHQRIESKFARELSSGKLNLYIPYLTDNFQQVEVKLERCNSTDNFSSTTNIFTQSVPLQTDSLWHRIELEDISVTNQELLKQGVELQLLFMNPIQVPASYSINLKLSELMLTVGEPTSEFIHFGGSYEADEQAGRRYFEKITVDDLGPFGFTSFMTGWADAVGTLRFPYTLMHEKRVIPSIDYIGTAPISTYGGTSGNLTINPSATGGRSKRLVEIGGTAGAVTAGQCVGLEIQPGSAFYIDAEL